MGAAGSRMKSRHAYRKERCIVINDWSVVGEFAMQRWIKTEHERWGFDTRVNYQTDIYYRLQPTSTGGRYLNAVIASSDYFELGAFVPLISATHGQFLMLVEKQHRQVCKWRTVKVPKAFQFDNLIDAPSLGKGVQVIGCRDSFVMIQVLRDRGTFEAILASYQDAFYQVERLISFTCRNDVPCIMEAIISPNHRKALVRPSWGYMVRNKVNEGSFENNVFLLDLETAEVIDGTLFAGMGTSVVGAFDPRHSWARVAVGMRRATPMAPALFLYDLQKRRRIAVTRPLTTLSSQNISFSPDGRFLAALMGDSGCRGVKIIVDAVHVYDPDTLILLRTFPCDSTRRALPITPATLSPLFSLDGRYMALQCSSTSRLFNHRNTMRVVAVPVDLKLKNLCRLVLRRSISEASLSELSLPQDLQDYLHFRYWKL